MVVWLGLSIVNTQLMTEPHSVVGGKTRWGKQTSKEQYKGAVKWAFQGLRQGVLEEEVYSLDRLMGQQCWFSSEN